MPELTNKYERAKIYMIESVSTGLVYIGSTCNDLHTRFLEHRSKMRLWQNGRYRYVTAFAVLSNPDAKILLVESFTCRNKNELNAREAFHIRARNCVNKVIPGRTHAEYRRDNREAICAWKRQPKHCETCNCDVGKSHFSAHTKTKKHQENLHSESNDEVNLLDSIRGLVIDDVSDESAELVGV